MIKPDDFFDMNSLDSVLSDLFENVDRVWDVLAKIDAYLATIFPDQAAILGDVHPEAVLINREQIYIGKGTVVEADSYITGPAYIGDNCEIRQGAYLRGNVIAGKGAVLGHTCEFKNSVLLPGAHAAHFAYVGDSVLGCRVNLGAGTKLSNLTVSSDRVKAATGQRPTIKILIPGQTELVDTGLAKFGAVLGDDVKTGCNAVLNPGCVVGPGTMIYSNVSLPKGYWAGGKIIKLRQQLEEVPLRD